MDGSALELRGLTKRFGNVTAVGGIGMKVEKGEVVALLGPNGAGKSTTIDMLLGLTTPDAGEVRVGGGTPREAVDAGEVGAMMQNGALLQAASGAPFPPLRARRRPPHCPARDLQTGRTESAS